MSRRNRNKGKVFPSFPYERRFTQAEQDVITARQQRLVEAFRDAVGIQGWSLGLPEDHLQLLMFHGALAGVDVDTTYPQFDPATGAGAFIRARRLPDAAGRYVDAVEWVVIKDDTPKDRARDARREAAAHVKQIEELDPDVRSAIRELFIARAGQAADTAAEQRGESDHQAQEDDS